MADASSTKTHLPSPPSSPSAPTKPPKSKFLFTNYFFSKSLMIILLLLLFSYFPSQVPEVFKETTLIPKLWDLIYLLVIGIAVCYGLFSRKTDGVHLPDDDDDNLGGNETYLSGISQISSLFEDGNHGIKNSCGFDEKSWNEGFRVSGSRSCEIGGGKKVNQGFLGESLVVINDEKFVLEQLGRQNMGKQQNLGSKSLDSAAGKSVFQDSDSDSRKWFKEGGNGKFRGLVPVKLEEKFKESGSGSGSDSDSDSGTRFGWRSKSMRLEKRDDVFSGKVDESGVLDSGMPSKIGTLSEKEESKGVEVNNRYRKYGETSFMESKFQENVTEVHGSFEENVKDFGKIKVDDGAVESKNNAQFVKSKSQSSSIGVDISSSIPKPAATIANAYKRGKSVRTNRSKEQVLEPKVNVFQSQTEDDKVDTRSKPGVEEMSDTEPHSGEVDRKAEEFIAKFREQIRLQKVASARKLNLL